MYVQGFVIPVPDGNKDAYRELSEKFWAVARDYGCRSCVECWEADVTDGDATDFRKAVNLVEGEKVVFSWMTWDSKAAADLAHEQIMKDERMSNFSADAMPFDGKRMIFGGFEPVFHSDD